MSIQGITPKEHINSGRRVTKKGDLGKKFAITEDESQSSEEITEQKNINLVSNVNPFIYLNEVNEEEKEKEILEEYGSRIINSLDEIRLSLLNGEIEPEYLINLKKTIDKLDHKFSDPRIHNIIQEIQMRAEIEIAKIEMNMVNN